NIPAPLQRHRVQEPQSSSGDAYRGRCELLVVGQIELVRSDLFRTQKCGRAVEVPGEERDALKIGLLRVHREVAELHVLEHALSKRRHWKPPLQVEIAAHAATTSLQRESARGASRRVLTTLSIEEK